VRLQRDRLLCGPDPGTVSTFWIVISLASRLSISDSQGVQIGGSGSSESTDGREGGRYQHILPCPPVKEVRHGRSFVLTSRRCRPIIPITVLYCVLFAAGRCWVHEAGALQRQGVAHIDPRNLRLGFARACHALLCPGQLSTALFSTPLELPLSASPPFRFTKSTLRFPVCLRCHSLSQSNSHISVSASSGAHSLPKFTIEPELRVILKGRRKWFGATMPSCGHNACCGNTPVLDLASLALPL